MTTQACSQHTKLAHYFFHPLCGKETRLQKIISVTRAIVLNILTLCIPLIVHFVKEAYYNWKMRSITVKSSEPSPKSLQAIESLKKACANSALKPEEQEALCKASEIIQTDSGSLDFYLSVSNTELLFDKQPSDAAIPCLNKAFHDLRKNLIYQLYNKQQTLPNPWCDKNIQELAKTLFSVAFAIDFLMFEEYSNQNLSDNVLYDATGYQFQALAYISSTYRIIRGMAKVESREMRETTKGPMTLVLAFEQPDLEIYKATFSSNEEFFDWCFRLHESACDRYEAYVQTASIKDQRANAHRIRDNGSEYRELSFRYLSQSMPNWMYKDCPVPSTSGFKK